MNEPKRARTSLPFRWPAPPLQVVLVEPQIPPNTGNIARLCAATGSRLHLVRPLGFKVSDRTVKRAGLDYWDSVDLSVHDDFPSFLSSSKPRQVFLLSTRGARSYTEAVFSPGDALVFGSETAGLPEALLAQHPGNVLAIPQRTEAVRSLNLANAVSIVLYEAMRQLNFP